MVFNKKWLFKFSVNIIQFYIFTGDYQVMNVQHLHMMRILLPDLIETHPEITYRSLSGS